MQTIIIKNFGAVEFAEIDISQIVILIGEQASGKSTVSKLIYFFKSLRTDFFNNIYRESKQIQDLEKTLIKKVQSKFQFYFGSNNLIAFSVKYYYSVKKDKYIEIIKEENNITLNVIFSNNFSMVMKNELNKSLDDIFKFKNSLNFPNFNTSNEHLYNLLTIINSLFEGNKESLYVPAGRNITVSYSNQFRLLFFGELSVEFNRAFDKTNNEEYSTEQSVDMHLMKEYFSKSESLLDIFKNSDFNGLIERKTQLDDTDKKILHNANKIIEKILKGEYKKDTDGEKIFYDKKNKGYVHLHNASSGQQEVIRILQDLFIVLLEKQAVFRVIEEPEAHLYPVAQKNIIDLIATVVKNTESQIIITTHSPYILSVFNNLLYSTKVAQKNKSNLKQINKIIPEYSQLNSKNFRAYSLKNISKTYISENIPYCQSIFDKETGLISQNYLDEVSEELGDNFDDLYNIHIQSIK